MDPIRRNITPPNVAPATPAGQAQPAAPAEEAARKFEVGADAGSLAAQGAQSGANVQKLARPNFERIKAVLDSPEAKSMPREKLVDHLIESETRHLFGAGANPDMVAAVSTAFHEDPHLSRLVNRLIGKAAG